MYPVLFHVGSIAIYSFGLFLAIGIVLGGLVVAFLSRKAHLSAHGLFDNVLFCIFGGVIGARLAYVVTYPQFFRPPLGSWTAALALWQGGLLFYGSVIGGLVAAWFVFRAEQRGLWRWLDLLFAGAMIGIAFGQIGCFFGGCAVGVESTARVALQHRIPTQLFESGWALLLAIAAFAVYRKHFHDRRPGMIFLLGMIFYFAGRLIIDAFRPMTVSFHQISGLVIADAVLLALCIVATLLQTTRHRRKVVEMH